VKLQLRVLICQICALHWGSRRCSGDDPGARDRARDR